MLVIVVFLLQYKDPSILTNTQSFLNVSLSHFWKNRKVYDILIFYVQKKNIQNKSIFQALSSHC
jgi:hypothetical protein